jgi:glutamate-1-semialdehyde 2,1-aminomutase
VRDALQQQLWRGTHLGGAHELQVEWAEQVVRLVPSAERVRFTSSGTEATLLALRVARAFTGRSLVIKLDGHFHGWHDEALSHFVAPQVSGVNPGTGEHVLVADPLSPESVFEQLAQGQVAAVILEPGGGGSGGLPWSPELLAALRQETRAHGSLLIFDEVVSGFRYSPGGVQQLCGVLPDLTVLAKILCGGLPGGAVAGRADIMALFGRGSALVDGRHARVPHTGTFNANPLSAAAGIAMLGHVADGTAQERARAAAEHLVLGVNALAEQHQVDVRLYAQSSTVHILIGALAAGQPLSPSLAVITLHAAAPARYATLRRELLVEGVDIHPVHGWVSAVHEPAVIQATVAAFERALLRLRHEEGFAL